MLFFKDFGNLFDSFLKNSLKPIYLFPDNNFARYELIAPTGGAIDISLSFKITINLESMDPALFIAS